MRRILLVLAFLFAHAAAAQMLQLAAGPEFPIGEPTLGEWPFDVRAGSPALATNGDGILLVHAGGNGSIYGLRFDRHGQALESVPKVLLPAGEDFAVAERASIHVVWHRGVYVIFFREKTRGLFALRVTEELQVLELLQLAADVREDFDVAAGGDEILIARPQGSSLLLRGDLVVRKKIALPNLRDVPFGERAAVYGDDRFAILTHDAAQLRVQFLTDGAPGPPVVLTNVRNDAGPLDAVWTGSDFAVVWADCVRSECLVSRMRVSDAGAPVGEPQLLGFADIVSDEIRVMATLLGGETVAYFWGDAASAKGRRYRGDTPIDPEPFTLKSRRIAAIGTAHDLLLTADSVMRVSVTPAASAAAIPAVVPLTAVTATAADEEVIDAAASPSEVAIIRKRRRHDTLYAPQLVATIFRRDGSGSRELALPGRDARVATDGERLYALTIDPPFGTMWFSELREGAPRSPVGREPYAPGLVWNGSEFVVHGVDRDTLRLWLRRVLRDGRLAGELSTLAVDAARHPRSMIRTAGGLLLLSDDTWVPAVSRLASDGTPLEEPQKLPTGTTASAIAFNGRTEAVLFLGGEWWKAARLRVAYRAPGQPLVVHPDWSDAGGSLQHDPRLVAVGHHFVALYTTGARHRTSAALLDETGFVDAKLLANATAGPLVPLSSTEALAIYTRETFDPLHIGVRRVFARVLTIAPNSRRRAVR